MMRKLREMLVPVAVVLSSVSALVVFAEAFGVLSWFSPVS
jgi:hypothetical protein